MSNETPAREALRIGKVRGVVLTKWQRAWAQRFDVPLSVHDVADEEQLTGLHEGTLDMCFVRLPLDRDGLHVVPLYEEQMVAWVSKDHAVSAVDEVTLADLADEQVITRVDGASTDLLLAGVVAIVPMSIARGASRRDLTYRPVVDAAPSPVALAWRTEADDPLLQEFVGVVRGRTVNSSRTQQERATEKPRRAPRAAAGRGGRTTGRRPTSGKGRRRR